MKANICKDVGRDGCLAVADPAYTMTFDDIGEKPIYWCAHCGAEAHMLNALLVNKLNTDPEGAGKLKRLLDEVKEKPR